MVKRTTSTDLRLRLLQERLTRYCDQTGRSLRDIGKRVAINHGELSEIRSGNFTRSRKRGAPLTVIQVRKIEKLERYLPYPGLDVVPEYSGSREDKKVSTQRARLQYMRDELSPATALNLRDEPVCDALGYRPSQLGFRLILNALIFLASTCCKVIEDEEAETLSGSTLAGVLDDLDALRAAAREALPLVDAVEVPEAELRLAIYDALARICTGTIGLRLVATRRVPANPRYAEEHEAGYGALFECLHLALGETLDRHKFDTPAGPIHVRGVALLQFLLMADLALSHGGERIGPWCEKLAAELSRWDPEELGLVVRTRPKGREEWELARIRGVLAELAPALKIQWTEGGN
jgi:hypothetical protein